MRLALIFALVPALAHAQDDEVARARAIFDEGTRHFEEDRFVEAAHAYELAYDVAPRPLILLNAATAYERALELDRAAELLARYLEVAGEIDDRSELEARLARLRELSAAPPEPSVPLPPSYIAPQIVLWPAIYPAIVPHARRPDEIVSTRGPSAFFVLGAISGVLALFSTAVAIGTGAAALDFTGGQCRASFCLYRENDRYEDAVVYADLANGTGTAGLLLGATSIVLLVFGALEPAP